jgi:ferritin-like metal-binding protein YciE
MDQEMLQELLVEQIRDIYDAEKQLVKALPKMAKGAESEELADAIKNHLQETQNQVARLEEVFEIIGVAAKGKPCKGMKGLIEEGSEALQEQDKGPLRDLAIIAGAQRVEHYEMSAYGTARTLAEHLGLNKAVELLQETEDEEKQADETLTTVATSLYESAGQEEEPENEEEMASVGASSRSGRGAASPGRGSASNGGNRKGRR